MIATPSSSTAFADARRLLARGDHHVRELQQIINTTPNSANSVWAIIPPGNAPEGGMRFFCLRLNRSRLDDVRAVAVDAAAMLISGFDHVAATCARLTTPGLRNTDRKPRLYYPMNLDDAKFAQRLAEVRERVGFAYADIFSSVRRQNISIMASTQMVKELANTGKHWALTPTTSSAVAIAFDKPEGGQEVVGIDKGYFKDHDGFEFVAPVNPPHFQCLLQFRFQGLAAGEADPGTVFSHAAKHLFDLINECEKITDG
jgi:hypothetical protein